MLIEAPTKEYDAISNEFLLTTSIDELKELALTKAVGSFGTTITYSPKVFIPLTQLCRDVCHYCTFAKTPGSLKDPFMTLADVVDVAERGAKAGCREALFTLGDRPELRYSAAREWLAEKGFASTADYLEHAARAVIEQTGLLPHINAGILNIGEMQKLRHVSASMGLMLESVSERLCEPGGPHYGSPDKRPEVRLKMLNDAGELNIPFTTGLLVGIGETRLERLEALRAISEIHARHNHIQEVIIQNFAPKPGTKMAEVKPLPLSEHLWTIAAARLILDDDIHVQAPPNLRRNDIEELLSAGVTDFGGVSPVTKDHVNPEADWPEIRRLQMACHEEKRVLTARLPIGPKFVAAPQRWIDETMQRHVLRAQDARGLARENSWYAGVSQATPVLNRIGGHDREIELSLAKARQGRAEREDIVRLFHADGADLQTVLSAANKARSEQAGEQVTFVKNRNINYTNICTYSCSFCAFSKSRVAEGFRDTPYVLDAETVAARAVEAQARGATEVCLQGGIHPTFTGKTYLGLVNAVHEAAPDLHIHAFSPLEVQHGAKTLNLEIPEYLRILRDAGLRSLPGTAAEILVDPVRDKLNASKISTADWTIVMKAAHALGLQSTATIMFGHVDGYEDWADHLLHLRNMQEDGAAFTEFVPLPFVHVRAPIWVKGKARSGPTYREALLMHAVARLVLGQTFTNIQTSWTKMGLDGAKACLESGANDLGGTLMNESISRAAGAVHGQNMTIEKMRGIAFSAGRSLLQRRTDYGSFRPQD